VGGSGGEVCVLEHFDGFSGPNPIDDLVIDFTIEGLTGDIVQVVLDGTSTILDIFDVWRDAPIHPFRSTEVTAELDLTVDSLLYGRSCSVPSCNGQEDFSETSGVLGVSSIQAQLLASVQTSDQVYEPEELFWGTTAQINRLGVSVLVSGVPEPSGALLFGVGFGVLAMRRQSSGRPSADSD
jgi:hypothetical protein